MRPYPGPMMIDEAIRIYNYRHSRACHAIESSFGIVFLRQRVFHKSVKAFIENVGRYTVACTTLHNFLCQTDNAYYSPQGFINSEDSNGKIKPAHWRTGHLVYMENNCFQNLNAIHGSCSSNSAVEMLENLKKYVNSEEGSLPWKIDYVYQTVALQKSFVTVL